MSRDKDAAQIERLEAELARLRATHRRVCEELDWRDEQVRVYRRIIERLASEPEDRT